MTTDRVIPDSDRGFSGSIPAIYERYLVPLMFVQYAEDLGRRLGERPLTRVLEVAAGTGAVTRRLASALPRRVSLVATDLNQAMLDHAANIWQGRLIERRQADALDLPFAEGTFDAVVCQFGVMFFPDKVKAFSEAHRVLKPGGVFMFNVWDRIEENDFADIVTETLARLFPEDPPQFLARTPHGYHDRPAIERDLASGGFTAPAVMETVAARSRAENARAPAIGFCQGTPLRDEIETRGPSRLEEATDLAEKAIAERFGSDNVDGKIQAHVVAVER